MNEHAVAYLTYVSYHEAWGRRASWVVRDEIITTNLALNVA